MTKRFPNTNEMPPDLRMVAAMPSETQKAEFRATTEQLAKRKLESLRLYEALPFQEKFHASKAKEAILCKGNQTGGSLAGFVEVARAVTGQDPYDKYPKTGGVVACLGFGEEHIGKVIYPYLFMAGKFRIIKDLTTGEWRTFKPWSDIGREKESKPAPPLIPQRFVKTTAWLNKSRRIFNRVDLATDWTIYAFNSSGLPSHAQGFTAALVHIDEDTDKDGWYDEMIARLSMAENIYQGCPGYLRWTAMPHAKNDDLVRLIERAEDEETKEKPSAVVIKATIFDNPYYPEKARADNLRIWQSMGEDVYRQRALGELTRNKTLMYPSFQKEIHNVLKVDDPRLPVQRILTDNNMVPPPDWCLYAVVDPGHTVCAVTFWCVPPETVGDHAVCYDELYIQQCDARTFGEKFAEKAKDRIFQAFIIDAHGARLTDIGSGISPREQYTAELKRQGISSVETKSGFRDGCDDIHGRETIVRSWMSIRRDGTTKMLVAVDRCPNLVREISRFHKRMVKSSGADIVTDEGVRKNTHAVETMEYAAADGLKFVAPPKNQRGESWLQRVMRGRQHREDKRLSKGTGKPPRNFISLGPGSSG